MTWMDFDWQGIFEFGLKMLGKRCVCYTDMFLFADVWYVFWIHGIGWILQDSRSFEHRIYGIISLKTTIWHTRASLNSFWCDLCIHWLHNMTIFASLHPQHAVINVPIHFPKKSSPPLKPSAHSSAFPANGLYGRLKPEDFLGGFRQFPGQRFGCLAIGWYLSLGTSTWSEIQPGPYRQKSRRKNTGGGLGKRGNKKNVLFLWTGVTTGGGVEWWWYLFGWC